MALGPSIGPMYGPRAQYVMGPGAPAYLYWPYGPRGRYRIGPMAPKAST
ncbi:MAG: hypothetical protein QOH87_2327, partial [Trebonia sp.]|nr:hypothetical protein [Trebonia sp.]